MAAYIARRIIYHSAADLTRVSTEVLNWTPGWEEAQQCPKALLTAYGRHSSSAVVAPAHHDYNGSGSRRPAINDDRRSSHYNNTIGEMHRRRLHIHDQTTMRGQEDPPLTTNVKVLAITVGLQIMFVTHIGNYATHLHIVWLRLTRIFKMQILKLQQLEWLSTSMFRPRQDNKKMRVGINCIYK